MITVANRTETAARVSHAFVNGKVRIDELAVPDRMLHIDSKALETAEARGRRVPGCRGQTQHGGFGRWAWAVSRTPSGCRGHSSTTLHRRGKS